MPDKFQVKIKIQKIYSPESGKIVSRVALLTVVFKGLYLRKLMKLP